MLDTAVVTPFGVISPALVAELCEVAGIRYNQIYQRWDVVSSEIEYWHLNRSEERRSNERKFFKKKGWLPVREMNFWYAMSQCQFNISSALRYAKEKLFDANNDPVYLPAHIAIKQGADPELRPYSYSSIMSEVDELRKNRVAISIKK